MLRIKNKLTVFHDANSVFSDYSREALDFDRDSFTTTLDASTSYLYIGFYKPINAYYVELGTANTEAGSFAGEYYNGSSWVSITNMYDETNSFTRSGFIQWDRDLTDEAEVEINGETMFFYRFRPSVTHSATVLNGLNIIFSDDTDLKREFFEASDFLPSGETSHILTHVASRDHIVQHLRNSGAFKTASTGEKKDVTAFDIHDLAQIKLASAYLTLSKIFGSVMDDPDGLYKEKSNQFMSDYSMAIKTPFIDLDRDDDGLNDTSEKVKPRTIRIIRQ